MGVSYVHFPMKRSVLRRHVTAAIAKQIAQTHPVIPLTLHEFQFPEHFWYMKALTVRRLPSYLLMTCSSPL
jgi:hypothetical protein